MLNPERGPSQFAEEVNKKEKPKTEPITSEQTEQVSGEIGESGQDPQKFFEKEYSSLGESYKGGLGLGDKENLARWDEEAKAHAEKRKKLEGIIEGLKSGKNEEMREGIDYLNSQMASKEEELKPLSQRENNLNDNAENMKQAELKGEEDYGYITFNTKNQELDGLYQQLNKEKKLAEPNKFRLNDLENNIRGTEHLRDKTKFGKVALELRTVQSSIERINKERNKLDILIKRLQERAA